MNILGPNSMLAAVPIEPEAGIDTQRLLEKAQKLAQLNARFEIALNNMARGLSMFDAEDNLIVCNELYREIYDLPEELTQAGTPFSAIIAYHAAQEGQAFNATQLRRQKAWIERHRAEPMLGSIFNATHKLDTGRLIEVTMQPLRDGGWVDLQEDVTNKRAAQERMAWLALHCPLTEIANRFHLRQTLEEALLHLAPAQKLAVHLFDLDFFKEVNDTKGHAAGDAVLKAVALRMREALREGDLVGRVGGDEFAIIQLDVECREEATAFAQRIVDLLNAPYRILGSDVKIGASAGTAIAPDHGCDHDTLFRKADMALYRAKSCGRGISHIYSEEIEALALEHIQLTDSLRDALPRRELDLYYKPVVDLQAGVVTGCEASMRWRHPRLGIVPQATFIPMAERCGLMAAMGEWAIRRACHDAATWGSGTKVAVNVSAAQLARGDLVSVVRSALDESGLDAERLEIEVNEATLLTSSKTALSLLAGTRALGARVILDDFGSSLASLNKLSAFTFDKIKIDRAVMPKKVDPRGSSAIVGAVVGLAKTLGLGRVAEGVDLEEVAGASHASYPEMQGIYFGHPVPSSEVEAAIAACTIQLSRSAPRGT